MRFNAEEEALKMASCLGLVHFVRSGVRCDSHDCLTSVLHNIGHRGWLFGSFYRLSTGSGPLMVDFL